jgi:hypothetical protein
MRPEQAHILMDVLGSRRFAELNTPHEDKHVMFSASLGRGERFASLFEHLQDHHQATDPALGLLAPARSRRR